jgi:predicted RNA-binding protein with PUA-like domain
MAKRFWLVKSEPDVYSLDALERDGSTHWDGVRNYQARNNLRAMKVGDEALFYHSNASPPGVVGIVRVCREAYPDPSQFDGKSDHFDPKSDPEDPRWSLVDVAFVARFPRIVTLDDVKAEKSLAGMELIRFGRLSVQSVTKAHFEKIRKMGGLGSR